MRGIAVNTEDFKIHRSTISETQTSSEDLPDAPNQRHHLGAEVSKEEILERETRRDHYGEALIYHPYIACGVMLIINSLPPIRLERLCKRTNEVIKP